MDLTLGQYYRIPSWCTFSNLWASSGNESFNGIMKIRGLMVYQNDQFVNFFSEQNFF